MFGEYYKMGYKKTKAKKTNYTLEYLLVKQ